MPEAPVVEELEPRILLSAGIHSALLGDVLSDAIAPNYSQSDLVGSLINNEVASNSSARNELIFVDAATPGYEQLVQQLLAGAGDGRNIDVIVIDSGSNGIDQISQALMGYANLDAIHFISHGTDGAVQLGNTWLDNGNLAGYADLISGWADALDADADLLFYGCDLASGADGRGLIAELAVLTGADIAASNDLTGHAALGGDWTLEHQTGVVEAQIVFGTKLQQNWVQTLSVTVDSSSSGTDINTDNITVSHTASGTERLIMVAIAFEPNGTETVDTITYNGVSLTLVGSNVDVSGRVRVEIWALVAPDTGTHDVVVNLTAPAKDITVGVMTFNGVNQGTPLGTYYSAEGDSSNASVLVGSAAGDLVFGFVGVRKGDDATPGAGQTEYEDVSSGNIEGAISTEAGAASVVTSWALDSSDNWIATGVSINAAGSNISTFQEGVGGYIGTEDTYLNQDSPSTSYGSSFISVDLEANDGDPTTEHQGLIQFANLFGTGPGQIPWGATILSATLTFDGIDGGPGTTISLHRMLQAWTEGDTWNSMSSGIQTNGIEAMIGADGSLLSPTTGTNAFTGLAAAVQAWANGDANYGWAIIASGAIDGWDISSSENSTASLRPRLDINWLAPVANISGTVYEDINGDGNLADGVGIGGVGVDLYLDDGDGVIDAGDTLVDSTTTDGSGGYTLTGSGDGTYWVVIDSTTITANAGYNGGFDIGDVWAEQTWGSSGAVSFDGSFGYLGTSGVFYGGMQYEVSDDASLLTTAEHVTRAIVSGANVISVDSAFSFSVVTRTGDGDDDPGADRSMQGSLRQFIQNSNAVIGIQTSQFAISTTDSGYNGTGNGEFRIQVGIGGYDTMTDTVILDATTQNGYSGNPIIELDGTNAIGSTAGLALRTNNSVIRGFIVHSFPDDGIEIDGQTGFGDNNTVQNNWVGLDATGAAAGNVDNGIILAFAATGNQIGGTGLNEGNVVAGNLNAGIALRDAGTNNNIIEGNYVGVGTDGVTAIGNLGEGVVIYSGASMNRIGGSAANAGNVISGNGQNGVTMWNATTSLNIVIGNRIGTDYTGTIAVGNALDGVHIGSGASNNTIGGAAAGERNLISGNLDDGVEIGNSGTTGNSVLGNYIGTNAAGTAALGNARHGVVLYDGVFNTTVGGTVAGTRNVISGNGDTGIVIDGNGAGVTTNNSIYGNYIGTNATGTAAIANAIGINIFGTASNNSIGGSGANEGNLISGNLISGIAINGAGTDNNTIRGNLIGTDVSGNTALGNIGAGINLQSSASGTVIGGTAAGEGNVISGNARGIQLFSTTDATTVEGNNIGVGADGVTAIGNINDGIIISDSSNNMIGGTTAGAGNIIANNGGDGVSLISAAGINNAILGNSIYGNAQLGIDLAGGTEDGFGVTANDPGDGDAGPNNLQNYPLLISANTDQGSNVYIAGSIHAAPSTTYRVEFFVNSSQDASGHGEGETFLGYIDVTTDATGTASFSASFLAGVSAGSFITTTATAPGLSTSEFSTDVVTLDMGTLVVDTSTDAVDGDTSSIAALLANRGADQRISLREAILATNATANGAGPDQIHFNLQLDDPNHLYYQDDGIAGSLSLVAGTADDDSDIGDFDPDYPVVGHSWYRIQPMSALPPISDAVIIDGYTQSGAMPNTLSVGTDAIFKIEINGDLSGNTNAFTITASYTELHGLVINGNFNVAIVTNASNVIISGNYIGTDITGMQAGANLDIGLYLDNGAFDNTIGGPAAADRNVISGTVSNAVWILDPTTQGNVVAGNYIGTNALGNAAIANASNAIVLAAGTHDNVIENNVISGNNVGIYLDGTFGGPDSNTIIGNLIGTDATGVFAVANAVGIWLQAGVTNTTIGGTNAAQRNVIAGNLTDGIRIHGAGTTGNVVLGNYIGTDSTGLAGLGNGESGIEIGNAASANTIGGTTPGERNVIADNLVSGIDLFNGAFGNFVEGNYIGVNASGATALGHGFAGIRILSGSTNNTIGGIAPGAGNVISGNSDGIYISDAGTIGNVVQGNLIGTDFSGTADIGNADDGIEILNGASGNLIGGTTAAARNIISGNSGDGISIRGVGTISNQVFGNYIGTNAAGTAALANDQHGVSIGQGATANTIGGTTAGARNVISGNLSAGVAILNVGTSANVVQGNYIGTNAAGDAAIANGSGGVRISDFASANTIGGTTAGTGNLISGNTWGVQIFGDAFGNFVQGNLIGTDWTGTSALGNAGAGVAIRTGANNNWIGGSAGGAGNVIAFNSGAGVEITVDGGSRNAILGNSIHSNTGLGIDLSPSGTNPNDPGDGDTGPNDLQNFPVLDFAVTDGVGTITIQGSINAAANTTYRIELFANVTGDIGGYGEGQIYLGFVDVVTDATGNGSFNVPLSAVIPPGYVISATATDPTGNTSEFAANIVATSLPPVLDLDADDSSGATGADYVTSYTENGGPVLIVDADGTLIDLDSTLQWMTVTITNLLDGLAELLAANTFGTSIIANYDSLTGILTLSGADTAANYQQVLRTITYNNSSDNPDTTSRVIEFVASDGGLSSNLATTTLSITAINDAPILSPASPSLPPINEDAVTNGGIQISTLLAGSVSDADTGAVQGIAVTSLVSGNGIWEYSTDGGFTWIAVGSVSDSNALLLRATDFIRFVPDAANGDTASFDFRAWDQTSGLFGTKVDTSPNGGISAFSSASDTADIIVTAVNDAPVLTPATPSMPTITEDDVNNGGILISTLLGGSVSDVDGAALGGIAVTSLVSGNGTWEYSTDGGFTWIAVGSVSDSNALLLRATDFIRFVPDAANGDTASFDFRAWDQTSGLFGTKVDTSSNGGTSAFSTATDTADITVNAVNDAPVLIPATPNLPPINEDSINNSGIAISTLLGLSATDVDNGALIGIAITGFSSGNGTWQYSLDGVTWIDVPSVSDSAALVLSAADRIRFVPDGENADSASFTFRAWDWTGGVAGSLMDTTTNGGITPFSSAVDTASITVSAVNDAPVLTPATPSLPAINEDDINNGGVLISTLLGGSVTDVDSAAAGGIAITGLSASNGTWEYSTDGGLTWLTVGSVSDSNALLLRATDYIRFVPDGLNAESASFDFRAWDQTNGLFGSKVDTSTNGGVTAFSTAVDTADITVGGVNDAPQVNDQSFTVDENVSGGTSVGFVPASDPDTGDTLTYSIVGGNVDGAFIIDSVTGEITVLNWRALDFETNPVFVLTIQVQDDGTGMLTDTATVTITLNNVNEAPVNNLPGATATVAGSGADGATSVFAADVDGDGDMDLISSSWNDDRVVWYQNDGAGNFTTITVATGVDGARHVYAADIDGDGDMDILVAAFNSDSVFWFENDGGATPGFTSHTISTSADGAWTVYAADMDGDGDMDVVSASIWDDKIAWYENDGGATPGFTEHVVTTSTDGARTVVAADMDGDGDMDLVVASFADNEITWFENDGAAVPGFAEHVISSNALGAQSVAVADIDGDGDLDVLSASYFDGKISLYINDGSATPTFTEQIVSTSAAGARDVAAADIDGDGDLDILAVAYEDNEISWFENDGATAPTFTEHLVSGQTDGPRSVVAADLDGDGNLDVATASLNDDLITYYSNGDGTLSVPVTAEDNAIVFSVANGNAIFISDVDAAGNSLRITLQATNGTLTLASISGLTFITGDGVDDGLIVFTGTLADINAALDGLSFLGAQDFFGVGTLQITSDDLGNTGLGTPLTDVDSINIDITAVNDIPTTAGIGDVGVNEDSVPVVIDLSTFSDIEDLLGQLAFSITGNTDPSLFTGMTIDTLLGTLTLSLTPDANGQATLTVRAVDTDGAQVETTFVVNIAAINDAPYTTGPGALSTLEDGPAATFNLYSLFGDIDDLNTSLTFTIVANDNTVLATASIDAATGTLNLDFGAEMSGNAMLTLRATDASGAFVDSNFLVTVDPVDDAVINIVPGSQLVMYGQFVLFSLANGTSISVSDIDSTTITVSLSVPNGLLTLGNMTGLTFSAGDGTGDAQMTFTGSISDVNAALDGLMYQPIADFDGVVALQIATWSPDLPLAERAPVSAETINIIVLDAIVPLPVVVPDPVDIPVDETAEKFEETETEDEDSATSTTTTAGDEIDDEFVPGPQAEFTAPPIVVTVNDVPPPDSGRSSPREFLSNVTRMLLQLSTDSKLPPFVTSDAVWNALDAMKNEMAGLDQAESDARQLLVTVSTGLTLTLSAGFVSWLMRAGSLVTSLLSTTPLWQRFDPLPVLGNRRDDDEEEKDKDADAVKAIFGSNA